MNKNWCFLITLLLVFPFVSCSSKDNRYHAIQNNSPRISTLGFYVSPPPGSNWYEKHLDTSLLYFKRTTPETYALTTKATELEFESTFDLKRDFLEYVKSRKKHFISTDQHKNCTSKYTLEESHSSLCVRYQHMYDDYSVTTKGSHQFIKVFNKGLVCVHPDSPKVGIDINYMEKSFPETNALSYRNEGETFISSLNFYKTSKY